MEITTILKENGDIKNAEGVPSATKSGWGRERRWYSKEGKGEESIVGGLRQS